MMAPNDGPERYARKAPATSRSGSTYRPQYAQRAPRQFSPKKAVKSFRDLDVYQKTIECAVLVTKDISPQLERQKYAFTERVRDGSLAVPLCVAQAHSIRFADFPLGLGYLEKAMAGCNKMIVYLEHIRGLYGEKFDQGLVEDLIGRYADARTKMFHLEKSWKKFRSEYTDGMRGNGVGARS
jgi:hypothetical protein